MNALTTTTRDALLAEINVANLARYEANAATPYIHRHYETAEARVHRLVAALADGDDDVAGAFNDALFDITHDGLSHMAGVFADIVRDIAKARTSEAADAADCLIQDRTSGYDIAYYAERLVGLVAGCGDIAAADIVAAAQEGGWWEPMSPVAEIVATLEAAQATARPAAS